MLRVRMGGRRRGCRWGSRWVAGLGKCTEKNGTAGVEAQEGVLGGLKEGGDPEAGA